MKKRKIVVIYSTNNNDSFIVEYNKHILNTIGISIENVVLLPTINHGEYSLSEVYNKSIKHIDKNYDINEFIFVFIHHDLIFKTKDWGRGLLAKFNNLNYQILGVAGSTYMPASGRWWEDRSKMVGIVEHTDGFREWVSEYAPAFKGVREVVLIDGLFMAADVDQLEHNFDEDFKGFHFYDLPFCIENYLDGANIGVVTDIRILHKSIGATNEQWEQNRLQFVEKYKEELPIILEKNVK